MQVLKKATEANNKVRDEDFDCVISCFHLRFASNALLCCYEMDPREIHDLSSLNFQELNKDTQQTIARLTKGYVDDMRNKLMSGRSKLSDSDKELMEAKLKSVLAYVYPIIIKTNASDELQFLDYLPIVDSSDDIPFDATDYEQGPRIGSERHCEVYMMNEPEKEPSVCLKKIELLSPEGKEKIIAMVEKVRKLSAHGNINAIYGLYFEDNVINIYSDLGDESLESARRTVDHMSVLRQIAYGLEHLHKAKISHGNLRPSNVIMKNGTAKITDVGIGHVIAGDEVTMDMCSTSFSVMKGLFSAPEIIIARLDGEPVNEFGFVGDIYSLGVIGVWCIIGKIPFTQNQLIRDDDFEPASVIDEEQHSKVIDVALPFIKRDPKARPAINEAIEMLNEV